MRRAWTTLLIATVVGDIFGNTRSTRTRPHFYPHSHKLQRWYHHHHRWSVQGRHRKSHFFGGGGRRRGAQGGGQVSGAPSVHSAATSSRHRARVARLLLCDALSLFLVLRSTAVALFRGTGSLQYGSSQHETHTCTTIKNKSLVHLVILSKTKHVQINTLFI